MSSNEPLVSIIIVNYNGKRLLEKCLESLMRVTYKNFEIILVDNNSVDESVAFVTKSHPSVIIIKLDKNYGFAEPCNIGAKNAKGDFFLFLNNDTEVKPDFLDELIKVMQDPEIAISQSLLLGSDGKVDSSGDFIDTLGRAYSSKNRENEIKKILSARGACMIAKKDVFWDLGGFDKKFFASFEDVDLGWRAWIWGYKIVLVPSSVVYHKGGQTTLNSNEIRFHGVKNSLVTRLTNFETYYATTSIAKSLGIILLRKTFGISLIQDPEVPKNPLPSFRTLFNGVVWVLKNLNYVRDKKRKVNSKRICSSKQLINLGLISEIKRKGFLNKS